jgi:hypothetical protein
MSTQSVGVPASLPSGLRGSGEQARSLLRRIARGRETDPAWSRPLLWLVALLAGTLTLWGLGWAVSGMCRQVRLILPLSFGHGRRCLGVCVLG